MKKIFRRDDDVAVMGVCGAIAAYYHVDVTLVRIATLLGTIVTGILPLLVVYLVAVMLIPHESEVGK